MRKDGGPDMKSKPGSNNNKNSVRVNNNFSLTINFGDSLNLLALIAGVYVLRRIAKKQKIRKDNM
ncbi:hypothetical protein ABES02_24205 [Neobacillus pocheonensis]|uniref:hypothetical protein n=1 Tax=Neobacillus pocheonensis TaxID=363869 RepID=UPI003D272D4A